MDELMQQEALGRIMASLPIHTPVEASGSEMQVGSSFDGIGFGGVTMKKEGTVGVVGGERVPQWSQQETREFISIRAELERDFNVSKRNKTLWEVVSLRMRERGFRRSPEQCKCKWKNLINRYKVVKSPLYFFFLIPLFSHRRCLFCYSILSSVG